MKCTNNNPDGNKLPSGLTASSVQAAIRQSGYPLQAVVANELRGSFSILEEWSYVDRETGATRSLDLLADWLSPEAGLGIYRPAVSLLVECKRSDLPYVFFKSSARPSATYFPRIAGVKTTLIELRDTESSTSFPLANCLGLTEHDFAKPETRCYTFSKITRKGKGGLELSGADPFNHIVLPIASAMAHLCNLISPLGSTPIPTLALGVCVLEGPMVLAEMADDKATTTELCPWVRIYRQEARVFGGRRYYEHYAIDIVHADFLTRFITDHVMPFFRFYAERAIHQQRIVEQARGVVPSLREWKWNDISPEVGA